LSTSRLRGYLERFAIQLSEDQIVEINLHIEKWFSSISSRLLSGHLIIVDYGAESTALYSDSLRNQGTLRGFKRHRFTDDVLSAPGEQDLTTTIDWDAVKEFGREYGFALKEFGRLDQFLLKCGVLEELDELAAKATSEVERLKLRTSLRELILPGGMAESFHVLLLTRCLVP